MPASPLSQSDAETIGAKIRDARIEAGLTQSDVAEALEISRVQVSKFESGHKWPNLNALVRLCQTLGTTPNHILDF